MDGEAVAARIINGALDTRPPGLCKGYDGEWGHVSSQLIALAEATLAEKFSWRQAEGVRSVSEVYMHIALANLGLLSDAGSKMPAELNARPESAIKDKAEVIGC